MRLLWDSSRFGTAIRVPVGYAPKPKVVKRKWKPTEVEDNALGRAARRRSNKSPRGWLPYAKR